MHQAWQVPELIDGRVLQNWTVAYRWYITAAASLLVLNSTFASSAPCEYAGPSLLSGCVRRSLTGYLRPLAGVVPQMMEYFTFSQEVGTLTIALYVLLLFDTVLLAEYIDRGCMF